MKITCCHHCEDRHEKCHAHCEEYLTQKILKIVGEASLEKWKRENAGIQEQRERVVTQALHRNHLRRRK